MREAHLKTWLLKIQTPVICAAGPVDLWFGAQPEAGRADKPAARRSL